jgi:hypothetical protein
VSVRAWTEGAIARVAMGLQHFGPTRHRVEGGSILSAAWLAEHGR